MKTKRRFGKLSPVRRYGPRYTRFLRKLLPANSSMLEEIELSNQNDVSSDAASELERAGLSLSDENLYDDGGKEVEAEILTRAKSIEEMCRIVRIATKHNLGVMAIGSLTSAIGAFKAQADAETHGLDGFIGVRIQPNGNLTEMPAASEALGFKQGYDFLGPRTGQLAGMIEVYKSRTPEKNHLVRAWAGLTPAQINEVLIDLLGYGHSVFLDLTTLNQAAIGAVVSNGSEGPVRANALFTLKGVSLVDKKGEVRFLAEHEARLQVGLGGAAGIVGEVVLEVIREGANEYGFFIPVPGGLGREYTGMVNYLPRVMAALDPYAVFQFEHDEKGLKLSAERGEVLLKGFEIVTKNELRATYAGLREDSEERGRIGSLLENMRDSNCHIGLLVNCTTDIDEERMINLLEALFDTQEDEENLFTVIRSLQKYRDVYRSEDWDDETDEDIMYFRPSEVKTLKKMREAIPEMTRASKYRGFTTSTDFNCRITADDPEMRARAYQAIMEVYWQYISDLRDRQFRVYIYGHMHPGDRKEAIGGGIDPHIRATYFLAGEDEDKQKRACEAWYYLQDRKKLLFKQLSALDGQYGIALAPGEKRISTDYAKWLEENDPEEAERMYRHMEAFGGRMFRARSPIKLHHHPPRIEGSLLGYFEPDPDIEQDAPLLERYRKPILYWCQNSHRSAQGKRVIYETFGLLRDWLKTQSTDRILLAETPEKALVSALRAFVNLRKKRGWIDCRKTDINSLDMPTLENTDAFVLDDPTLFDNPNLEDKACIYMADELIKPSKKWREKASAIVYCAESFGTESELGILLTDAETLKKAAGNRSINNAGYAHSLFELNDKTHETIETPKMQAIAELGCLLAKQLGFQGDETLCFTSFEEACEYQTCNPGPSQINQAIIEQSRKIAARAKELKADKALCKKELAVIEASIRRFFGVPNDFYLLFTGSATQAMEQILESLSPDLSVVGIKGAFGERMFAIAKRFSQGTVKSVRLRWGEGENSQIKSIAAEMFAKLPANPKRRQESRVAFFITSHETSTGVHTNVRGLSKELGILSYENRLENRPLRIVDGTSDIGLVKPDFREVDIYFGSVQKFLGCPAGLGLMIVSPSAMHLAEKTEASLKSDCARILYRTLPLVAREQAQGAVHNLRGVLQLKTAIDDYRKRGGVRWLRKETQKKFDILKATVDANPHLVHVVDQWDDQSEIMLHIAGVDIEVRKLRDYLLPFATLGNGYGPYKGETLRIYLTPNLPVSFFRLLADAIDNAIEAMIEAGETMERKVPRKCKNLDLEWYALHGRDNTFALGAASLEKIVRTLKLRYMKTLRRIR